MAAFDDTEPCLTLTWDQPQTIQRIELTFDTDFDHPMESALMGHPEHVMPFCVKRYTLRDAANHIIASAEDNHQTRNIIILDKPVHTDQLYIELGETHGQAPAALFDVRCYAMADLS